MKKSLDASLLGLANVVANCYLGSGRVARLDCVDNRAMLQQRRFAALTASYSMHGHQNQTEKARGRHELNERTVYLAKGSAVWPRDGRSKTKDKEKKKK